jgi:hypothetical protein
LTDNPLLGSLLQAKARSIAHQLNIEDFSASNGWLQRFQNRYSINFNQTSNECYEIDEKPMMKIQKMSSGEDWNWADCQTGEICEYLDETNVAETERAIKIEDRLDSQQIDTALSTMLISCGVNFDVIDSPFFKRFVATLNPNYQLPSGKNLKQRVISKLEDDDQEA